jgi:hypothetical protein
MHINSKVNIGCFSILQSNGIDHSDPSSSILEWFGDLIFQRAAEYVIADWEREA